MRLVKVLAGAALLAAIGFAVLATRDSDPASSTRTDGVAVAATSASAQPSSSAPVSIPAEAPAKAAPGEPVTRAGAPAKPAAPTAAPASAAAASGPPRPTIRKRLIPYPQSRKGDMAAYSKRHYGEYKWALTDPKLIVIHFAEAGSISSIYNTFAPNRPDVEYGELPGVCSHYAVSAKGVAFKLVPPSIRCRHVVGLNQVAIGIEHVGYSDGDVLGRTAEFRGSLRLTQWLRCRFGIPIKGVIGHAESLSSPYYEELDPDFQGRTHGDFPRSSMRVYRRGLGDLGPC